MPSTGVPLFNSTNMTVEAMRERIRRIKDGFETEVVRCMGENKIQMAISVREQLYSGIDGNGAPLSPSYSRDPWFQNPRAGFYDESAGMFVSCYRAPQRYVEWKSRITPPEASSRLGLSARDADTPNLFIVGTFHGSIDARATARGVEIFTAGWDEGPAVERKYGSQIFGLSEPAVTHFNTNYLMPWLRAWLLRV